LQSAIDLLLAFSYPGWVAKAKSKEDLKAYYLRLPADLHAALVEQASLNRRSLAQEIIVLLERGLEKKPAR